MKISSNLFFYVVLIICVIINTYLRTELPILCGSKRKQP